MLDIMIEDGIYIAKFSAPPVNAISMETMEELRDVMKQASGSSQIKGIILTGEGKFFSSGFHLPTFLGFHTREDILAFFNVEEEMLYEIFTFPKPMVAAINGHMAAGGMISAMGCDYRIVKNHPKIRIGMSEIKIGLGLTIAEMELMRFGLDSNRLLSRVMFFGEMVDVNTALQRMLVDEVVEEAELIPRARAVICEWWDKPGKAFLELKRGVRGPAAASLRTMLDTIDWQTPLVDCLLKPETRSALDFANKMMGG